LEKSEALFIYRQYKIEIDVVPSIKSIGERSKNDHFNNQPQQFPLSSKNMEG